ncbi:hypothetical protein [Bradyrhizobium sp. Arg816]|uniref:hypothetical protein n=1 Tax=Bradyrhizobium sp. Arg816 TaxID=2998491 RepID=UPI00249F1CA9|nr:hypothetical protein [Bradyrhizobium sp. Arg816]MDI3567318.1 hypothetical protein [Bradyrhizobium sp. Arg816]
MSRLGHEAVKMSRVLPLISRVTIVILLSLPDEFDAFGVVQQKLGGVSTFD